MSYTILIEKRATKEAESIPPTQRKKIDKAITSLAAQPRPRGCKKLTPKNGYRIRVGNYRVLYSVDDDTKVVVIYRIKIKGKSTYK